MKKAYEKVLKAILFVYNKIMALEMVTRVLAFIGLAIISPVLIVGLALWFCWLTPFVKGLWKFCKKLWKNKKGRTGIIMVGIIMVIAVFAPVITVSNPNESGTAIYEHGLAPFAVSANGTFHLLGTDGLGADVWSKIAYGAQVSLKVGIFTAFGVAVLGAVLGLLAGYFGGWTETIIMRIVDVLLVIPALPLMMMVASIFAGNYNINVLIFMFVIFGWYGTCRVIRAQVLSLKQSNYVKAAQLAGAKGGYIMFKHILPGVSNLLIMNIAMSSAGFMVAEAGLSFIGLGDPHSISWGKLIVEAQSTAMMPNGPWWLIIIPGLAIFYAVISFMQVGLACEEIFNPRMGSANKSFNIFKRLQTSQVDEIFAQMDIEGDTTPNKVVAPAVGVKK